MTCAMAREDLSARHDRRLGAGEGHRLAHHLEGCAGCRQHARNLDVLTRALHTLAAAGPRAPEDLQARLQAQYGRKAGPWWRRRATTLFVATALGAAAAVCLVSGLRPRAPVKGFAQVSAAKVEGFEVRRQGAWHGAGSDEALFAGDLVRTGADRRARLRIGGHTTVEIGADTQIEVGPLGRSGKDIAVDRGFASFAVEPGQGGLAVETPAGDLVVTGTSFTLQVVPRAQQRQANQDERGTMKTRNITIVGGALVGAVATVQVSKGEVRLQSAGQSLALVGDERGEMRTGLPPARLPRAEEGPAIRLARANAELRREIGDLRAQAARRVADATTPPKPGAIATTTDPRAPLTSDERKLLGAINLKVAAETRQKLATVYQEAHGKPPSSELDEIALAKDLLADLRFEHMAGPAGRPPVPPTAAKTMDIVHARNQRVEEELARSLSPSRAAAVAATIKATTNVGIKNGARDPGHMTIAVPPREGEALPAVAPEKRDDKGEDQRHK